MTDEEMLEIHDKISRIIFDYDSYHVYYSCSTDCSWNREKTMLYFEVYGFSDQGEGSEWTEFWSIDNEGKIYSENKTYNNLKEFESDWI